MVVKLRPVEPADLPAELRRNAAVKVEVDVMPGGYVCSASFRGKATAAEISDTVAGRSGLPELLSKDQRAFFADHAPSGIELDRLISLGPTFLLKTMFTPEELGRRVVVEMWLYPDGSRILELSMKCLPSEAFQVSAEARLYLHARGIDLSSVQQTKTRAALDYYRDQLKTGV